MRFMAVVFAIVASVAGCQFGNPSHAVYTVPPQNDENIVTQEPPSTTDTGVSDFLNGAYLALMMPYIFVASVVYFTTGIGGPPL